MPFPHFQDGSPSSGQGPPRGHGKQAPQELPASESKAGPEWDIWESIRKAEEGDQEPKEVTGLTWIQRGQRLRLHMEAHDRKRREASRQEQRLQAVLHTGCSAAMAEQYEDIRTERELLYEDVSAKERECLLDKARDLDLRLLAMRQHHPGVRRAAKILRRAGLV